MKRFFYILVFIFFVSCNTKPYTVTHDIGLKSENDLKLFTLIPNDETGVDFSNTVEETEELNFLNFGNIYNGGGVATSDFNNDGLVDIFFYCESTVKQIIFK